MPTTKKLATWLWTQLKSEMRFQKAERPVVSQIRQPKEELTLGQKAIRGGNNAVRNFFFIVIVLVIFSVVA